MGSGLDAFLKEMQKKIDEETREDFGEIVYQRWQNPLYMGVMDNPDGSAIVRGTCGDAMQIFLKIQNDRVVQASFQTDGCGPTVVCGSYAVEMSLPKKSRGPFFDIGAGHLVTTGRASSGTPALRIPCC